MSDSLNDAFFRALFHSQLGGIAVADLATAAIIDINELLLSILGCSREDIVGIPRAWRRFTPPEFQHLDEAGLEQVLRFGYSEPFEKEYLRSNGTRVPVRISSTIVAEYPDKLIVYVTDLSRAKESIAREEAVEQRLRIAISAAQQGVWDYDLVTGTMTYSRRAKEIYGLKANDDVTFERIRDATHPEDLPLTHAQYLRAIDPAVRDRSGYEYRIVRPDGTICWAAAFGEAIFEGEAGSEKAVRYVGTLQDITERKTAALAWDAAEQERRESEARFQAVFDSDLIGLTIFDAHSRVTETINDRFLAMTGHTRADFDSGRWNWRDFTIEEYLPLDEAAIAQAQERGWWDPYEKEYRALDGRRFPVRISSAAMPGFPGKVVVSVEDISERRRWEQHQRLLIGELNHRVKNTLAVVQSLAHHSFAGEPSSQQHLASYESRLVGLAATHNLLTKANWALADLEELVRDSLKLHETDGTRIKASGPKLAVTPTAAVAVGMALNELATNALKYGSLSSGSGHVEVSWGVAGPDFQLCWREKGGPPVTSPSHRGFGSKMIKRAFASSLSGTAELSFAVDGVRCFMQAPTSVVLSESVAQDSDVPQAED